MKLMISERILRAVVPTTHAVANAETMSHATGECALGLPLIARSASGVCAILIGADRAELEADLAARFPQAKLVANEDIVDEALPNVIRFVGKPSERLHLSLDMRGTQFQRHVAEKLRAIPAGSRIAYMELARWISLFASPVRSLAPVAPI